MNAFELVAMRSAVEVVTRYESRTAGLPSELRRAFVLSDAAIELAVRCCDVHAQAPHDGSEEWYELAGWTLIEFTPFRGWHLCDALVGEYLRRVIR